jgi:ribosome-binding protein aMBF1 (putative translation factor)
MTENIRPVDRSVGRRVRMLRVSRGMSQTALASQLGLTFQQLQKYESLELEVGSRVGGVVDDTIDRQKAAVENDEPTPRRAGCG